MREQSTNTNISTPSHLLFSLLIPSPFLNRADMALAMYGVTQRLQDHSSSSNWTDKNSDCPWQVSPVILQSGTMVDPPPISDLSVSLLSLHLPTSLLKYPSLEEIQFIIGHRFSHSAEEANVVGRVVDHEQDASQQLIGHQQVVQVRPLVVHAAVAATPLHQGPEVVLVPGSEVQSRLKHNSTGAINAYQMFNRCMKAQKTFCAL